MKSRKKRKAEVRYLLLGVFQTVAIGIDIIISMDYPFLQPRHLEQEMRGGPLHLYTSVFGVV